MTNELVRRADSIASELRGFLWSGRAVAVRTSNGHRIVGWVESVQPTGGSVLLDQGGADLVAVPVKTIIGVRLPHWENDDTPRERRRRKLEPEMAGQLRLRAAEIPKLSRRSAWAGELAEASLLPQDEVDVLAALDRAIRVTGSATASEVSAQAGRSPQYVGRRLIRLQAAGIICAHGRPKHWFPKG